MPTDCSDTQLVFEAFAGRKVVAEFDGGAITSNAGALLLREADCAMGLTTKGGTLLSRRTRSDPCSKRAQASRPWWANAYMARRSATRT